MLGCAQACCTTEHHGEYEISLQFCKPGLSDLRGQGWGGGRSHALNACLLDRITTVFIGTKLLELGCYSYRVSRGGRKLGAPYEDTSRVARMHHTWRSLLHLQPLARNSATRNMFSDFEN